MFKKFAIVGLSALVLGGCSLIGNREAAKDVVSATNTPIPSSSPVVAQPDPELDKMTAASTGTDTASIEKDLNETKILNEDFSDIK